MKRILTSLLLLPAAVLLLSAQPARTVVLITASERMSPEEQAALQFLKTQKELGAVQVPLANLRSLPKKPDVLWVHLVDQEQLETFLRLKKEVKLLKKLFDNGTKMICTDYAAMLPFELGIERNKPSVRIDTIQNDWLWDKRGFQSFRGHPLFDGMFGGEYVWDPNVDQLLPFVGYFNDEFPAQGKVIGVDKAYVFVYSHTKLVIEHSSGKGKMISIGSSVYFSKENNLRNNLEHFILNTIDYFTGKVFTVPATYWERYDNIPKEFAVSTAPLQADTERSMLSLPNCGLLFINNDPQNQFFETVGRRAAFMGKENGGIEELWVHPFKVFYQYRAGVVNGDSVQWLQHMPVKVEIRPESFTRMYTLPQGELREIVFSSLWKGGGVVHYESTFPLKLIVKFKSDLRWMWPYDMNALGDVYYGYDQKLNALHIKDVSGDFYTIVGSDVPAESVLSGQYESIRYGKGAFNGSKGNANIVAHAASYSLNAQNKFAVNIAVIGTNTGKEAALQEYRAMLAAPKKEYAEAVNHYKQLIASTLTINGPDERFNMLFKWAIVATDKFSVYTPGVGTALLAGYATTATGWNGGQKISGRPGYAWYFGRDAAWASFAIDDYGNTDMVRNQLEFFETYQDASGKIFHEISTSGVVHYDASDATPLYVILAGHYLRATGDIDYLKKSWPHLKKAMDFLYSTDTDGDGLIENTNVGHGWLEGGALFGAHTEFYLAALWAQALKEMSSAAALMEEYPLSDKYQKDFTKVKKILNVDFWNDSTKFYNLGKMKNGTYQTEMTVLPAVTAYFNFLDDAKAKPMIDAYSTNRFSSDWGVRIVSSSSPHYKPTGYHYGSIWPLFTGWAALAEYEYGNSTQGFMHIWDNMNIMNHWALGYVEEVMHGEIYRPTGVCPHQCWSETNIIHPTITGMVGWKPNAVEQVADFKPRFPASWDSVSVQNLKIGKTVVDFSMKRSVNGTEYSFELRSGPAVDISFAPELPFGMKITSATLDGKSIAVSSDVARGVLSIPVIIGLNKNVTLQFRHTGGIGLDPVMPEPPVGDSSMGFRIGAMNMTGKEFIVTVEGKSGDRHDFGLNYFDNQIIKAVNGEVIKKQQTGKAILRVSFDSSSQRYSSKEIRIQIQEHGTR